MGRHRKREDFVGSDQLLGQVKREFEKKKGELGARNAARILHVCLASFYNYMNGKKLPPLEVLARAQNEWKILWNGIDATEVLRQQEMATPHQYVLSFLEAVDKKDVEIVHIGPRKHTNALEVTFKIRFSA